MLLLLALIPPFIAAVWFYKEDKHPEPIAHTIKAVLSGVLACGFVLLLVGQLIDPMIGQAFKNNALISSFVIAFFCAALPEEFLKFVFLRRYIISDECDEPYDLAFYGAMVSIGFAAIENVFYVYEGGIETAIIRAFTAVPMHAMCGAMIGYGLLQINRNTQKDRYFTWASMKGALFIPVMFHGLYDWPLFVLQHEYSNGLLNLLSVIVWFGIIIYFVKRFIKIMKEVRKMT